MEPCPAVGAKVACAIVSALFPAEEAETLIALPKPAAVFLVIAAFTLVKRKLNPVILLHRVGYLRHHFGGNILEIILRDTRHKLSIYSSRDLLVRRVRLATRHGPLAATGAPARSRWSGRRPDTI